MNIWDLEMPIRVKNCLRNSGINTTYELQKFSESWILRLPNFGYTSLRALRDALTRAGVEWCRSTPHSEGFPHYDDPLMVRAVLALETIAKALVARNLQVTASISDINPEGEVKCLPTA